LDVVNGFTKKNGSVFREKMAGNEKSIYYIHVFDMKKIVEF